MNLIDPIIAELAYESATTRRVLERIPEDKLDWKPHEKSMSFITLGSHFAETFEWTGAILNMDVFEMDPTQYKPWVAASKDELLAGYDSRLKVALESLEGQENDHLMKTWQMKVMGKVELEMPRIAVIRSFQISHMIHHRGQLGVYLRLNDIPVPAVYGPSADEDTMGG